MQAHHRRSLWPGAPPTTMLPGFVPDETTTIGEAPLTKPKVWFDARANKARITYPPGGGPFSTRGRTFWDIEEAKDDRPEPLCNA